VYKWTELRKPCKNRAKQNQGHNNLHRDRAKQDNQSHMHHQINENIISKTQKCNNPLRNKLIQGKQSKLKLKRGYE
jgi:hypothetical protein